MNRVWRISGWTAVAVVVLFFASAMSGIAVGRLVCLVLLAWAVATFVFVILPAFREDRERQR